MGGIFFEDHGPVSPYLSPPEPATPEQLATALREVAKGEGFFQVASRAGVTFDVAQRLINGSRAAEVRLTVALADGTAKNDAAAVAAASDPDDPEFPAAEFVRQVKERAGDKLPVVKAVVVG